MKRKDEIKKYNHYLKKVYANSGSFEDYVKELSGAIIDRAMGPTGLAGVGYTQINQNDFELAIEPVLNDTSDSKYCWGNPSPIMIVSDISNPEYIYDDLVDEDSSLDISGNYDQINISLEDKSPDAHIYLPTGYRTKMEYYLLKADAKNKSTGKYETFDICTVVYLDKFASSDSDIKSSSSSTSVSSNPYTSYYYCKNEKTTGYKGEEYILYPDAEGNLNYHSLESLIDQRVTPIEFDCSKITEKNKPLYEKSVSQEDRKIFEAYKRCCEEKSKKEDISKDENIETKSYPKRKSTKKKTPTLETEPETKIPEDYIFPDFANDPEEESGIGRRKKPQVQPELDTDIDNMIEDVERKRGFFPTNADVKGIMRGESFINFREQDTRGKEVISEMQKLMRDAGANIQPDGSFGKEMKEKLSNLLSKPISFLGKEQYLKLAEMAHEKGKTNWLIGYVAANEGVSPEEYYELMNNKETRKEMVSALKEEGLGRLRTLIKNRRSARAKGIPRSKRRRFFKR